MKAKISVIKPSKNYDDISTVYPDYDIDESVYDIKVSLSNPTAAQHLLTNTSVFLDL